MIGRTPFFALPGNPASAYLGFELFMRPAILKMAGHTQLRRPVQSAILGHDIQKSPGLRYFMRGTVCQQVIKRDTQDLIGVPEQEKQDTCHVVRVTENQSNTLLSSFHKANCLLVLPEEEADLRTGAVINCIRLDVEERVKI